MHLLIFVLDSSEFVLHEYILVLHECRIAVMLDDSVRYFTSRAWGMSSCIQIDRIQVDSIGLLFRCVCAIFILLSLFQHSRAAEECWNVSPDPMMLSNVGILSPKFVVDNPWYTGTSLGSEIHYRCSDRMC